MGDAKNDYGKGYVDGSRAADREEKEGFSATISDVFTPNPHYDSKGSETYKSGWNDGHKDGWDKK